MFLLLLNFCNQSITYNYRYLTKYFITIMSGRKRQYQTESISSEGTYPYMNKSRRSLNINTPKNDYFSQHNIWDVLERIELENSNVTKKIKGGTVFIPLHFDTNDIENIEKSIDTIKKRFPNVYLRMYRADSTFTPLYLFVTNFNSLEISLIITVILAFKNKRWIIPFDHSIFNIPLETVFSGSIFLPQSVLIRDKKREWESVVKTCEYESLYKFKEFFIRYTSTHDIYYFMVQLTSFFNSIKFGNVKRSINKIFKDNFYLHYKTFKSGMYEFAYLEQDLFDMTRLIKNNKPLIDKSINNLVKYVNDISAYDIGKDMKKQEISSKVITTNKPNSNSTTNTSQVKANTTQQTSRFSTPSSRGTTASDQSSSNTQSRFNSNTKPTINTRQQKSNFMTQEQIKEHCEATIKSTRDKVSTMPSFQIIKTYIKCPRQQYADVIFKNLNDLRSKSNCNIVILHLNNVHESYSWFNDLDVSRYTHNVQQPHPMTIRVVSIGGTAKDIQTALHLIESILSN